MSGIDNDTTFPQFLTRSSPDLNADSAPDQPTDAHGWQMFALDRRWTIAAALALGVTGLSAAVLVVGNRSSYAVAPPTAPSQIAPKIERIAVRATRVTVAASAAEKETRVGYASNMVAALSASQNSNSGEQTSAAPPPAEPPTVSADAPQPSAPLLETASISLPSVSASVAEAGEIFSTADPIAMLVIRNLPAGVTFKDGVEAGDGAWALPSGDPSQLVTSLEGDLSGPVTADIDMVSRSGATRGSVRVQLSKTDGEVELETLPSLSLGQVSPEPAEAKETADNEEKAEEQEDVAKPSLRPRQRAQKRQSEVKSRSEQVAEETAAPKRKSKRRHASRGSDAYKTTRNYPNAAPRVYGRSYNRDAVDPNMDEQPKGPLSKFFSWMQVDSKPPPADEPDRQRSSYTLPTE